MKLSHYEYGLEREGAAGRFLQEKGAILKAERFRTRGGEIDLVLEWDFVLVFVEVRARSHGGFYSPVESISRGKQARIRRAARVYLSRYKGTATEIRFDVLGWDGEKWTHYRDAFT